MRGFRSSHWLGILLVSGIFAALAWAETLEMVTYYPAPAATTSEDLHVRSLTVGTSYNNETPRDGEALIFDRLGIGTNAPAGPLHVVGVDDSVSSIVFVPGADTGVAGTPDIRVGIGTANPATLLEVYHPQDAAYLRVRGIGDPDNFSAVDLASDEASDKIWQVAHKFGGGGARNDLQVAYFDGAGWSPKVTVRPNGNVGIGTQAPVTPLHVAGVGNSITIEGFHNTGTAGPDVMQRRARGSATSPQAVQNGDDLGGIIVTGYDGAGWAGQAAASIDIRAAGAPVAGSIPGAMVFSTNGGTNLTTRMWLSSAGNMAIGTNAPTANPSPANNQATANLDVNDIWLRAASGGAGAWVSALAGGGTQNIVTGTYTGNGVPGREIDLGVSIGRVDVFRFPDHSPGYANPFTGTVERYEAYANGPSFFNDFGGDCNVNATSAQLTLGSDTGIKVYGDCNENNRRYFYVVYKKQ